MSQFSGGPRQVQTSGENDIYTGLLFVAFLFVLAATIFVGYKCLALFGTILPPAGG